ncbi:breast cancer type 2 susceptibility protein [Neolamprologus brichardi]|uniref:breast cancer type 2 susceptibility protein n=1 Tax=Neolamprologus brichardi TaxID=32507 RepID=UPI001643D481|nr:breast cancer type 2 susceptibility protein [Neolamprologus brichardi]
MDLPLKNMYETFKDEIWKELGPLDHKWFDILTAQTSANEGSGSDQDELCANQEGHFKTPLDKTAVDSQLFSTPKVFRHSRIVSPEIEDEQSFSTTQENDTLPWTETQSPYMFRISKKGVPDTKYEEIQPQSQDNFDPLDTPHKSPMSYAKHISESLGAQINPDISWTSSLNTPPPVPSTLILSKVDESPCPVSVSADKSVVFVRKLFPSLSNPSRIVVAPPKNDNITTDNHDAVLPEVVSSQTLLTQNEGIWQQILQGANGDGKMASAPDEFQNASSTFLANSSSALRKVKPDRIRRKQFKLSEHDCSSTDISKTNQPNEEHKADEEHSTVPSSPPAKNGSTGISQWSPLNLSEIPPCTAENNILTELQPDFDSRQLVRPPIKITDTGLIRKKRKFVYTVETLKPKVKENETNFQKINTSSGIPDTGPKLSSKQSEDAPDEASCCSNEKNAEEKRTLENLPSSVQEKVQDLDMSQLHKDFAQDFSQISDSGTPTKGVAEDQDHFSPSACLLAMKKAKHQTIQASIHHDYNSISNTGHTSTTNQNYSTNEGTISDSGFQSAVADITHTASSCIVPCSENTGSKTDIHRTTPFPSTHRGNEKSQLLERQTTDGEREGQLDMESTLTQLPSSLKGTDDGHNCIPQNGEVHGRLLEKTNISLPPTHASGFKTASNKGIQISLANLEKARHLFEERNGHQPTKCNSATKRKNSQSNGSMKSTVSVSNQQPSVSEIFEGGSCHLTASQKADVTELCTLLEEADSQFEFTQFRGAEVKQPCQENACFLEKTDKDLDPDFLAGIDFDDSFSSDAEKHLAITAMPDKMTCVVDEKANGGTSNITDKSTGVSVSSSVKRENISAGEGLSSSEDIPGRNNWLISKKQKSLNRAEHGDASKMEKPNPLMLSVTFKTAGGNALRVSKTCLSKARALFADLEINVSDLNISNKQAAETDAKTKKMCNVDSETAKADFKFTLKDDCHVEEKTWSCFSNTKQPVSALKQARDMQDKDTTKNFENCKIDAITISEEHAIVDTEFENVNTGLSRSHPDDIEMERVGCNTVLEFKNPVSFHENSFSTSKLLPCPASKSIDSSAISELSSGDGFCTASGRKVSVSADAMKKAKCLLNDTYSLEDTTKKISQKENVLRTAQFTAQNKESIPKTSGFDTATGKGVSISSTAHKKAKCPLSESDKVYHKINAKPSHYKIPVYGPPPSNVGFLAASGKKIAFSSKALQKAKALFSDISFSADSPAGPHPKNGDKKNDNCEHPDKMQSGLTAEGENVHVSEKHILKDFEDSVLTNAMQERVDCDIDVNNGENIMHTSGSGSDLGIGPDQGVTSNISVESANKQVKQKDSLPLQSGGFGPVNGKGVSISSEALKRATSLLEQCDEVNTKINVNQSHLKTSVYSPLPTSGGFHAASGKALTLSSEALQKAKTLFSDIISSAESPVVPHTRSIKHFVKSGSGCTEDKNKQLKKEEASFPLQSGGFQTASGKGLAISSEALKKAKSLLREFDELGDRSGKPSCSKTPVPENGGFLAPSGKPMGLSSEALQKAKTLFSDIISSAESPHAKNSDRNHDNCEPMAKMQSGFKTAGGKKVHVSQKDLLNAKHLLKVLDDSVLTKAMQMAEDCDMDVNNGISAKHKSVAPMVGTGSDEKNLPETRLQQKATLGFSVESEKRYTEDKDKQAEQKNDTLSLQTASGKGVTIASEALRKARSLLGECDEMEDKIGINPSSSKIPVHDSLPQNGGFRAASGKPVALSSEALQRAKALFDLSKVEDVEGPSGSNLTTASDKYMSTKGTASLVVESVPSLQESDLKVENLRGHGCTSVNNKAAKDAFKFQEDTITPSGAGTLHDCPEEEMQRLLDYEINKESSTKESKVLKPNESSVLNFQSLNLTGCTETQQKFLAQEALDCTKALLEDEGLADHNLLMTLENMPLQHNTSANGCEESEKRRGKRSVEDTEMNGQPPLKRRLLEEFDRSLVDPKASTLHPVKSCSNGLMKDRGVFKYSTSLYPNITRPHSGKTYVETRFQKTQIQNSMTGDPRSKSAHYKTSAFVPPFVRNAKTETHKNMVLKDSIRTPLAFVPPFKKQRTIVQESSCKAHEGEDKHQKPFVMSSNSKCFVPPTKKTQGAVDGTAVAAARSDDMNNQSLPVDFRSVSAVGETSGVDGTCSRSQDVYQNLQNTELAQDMQDMRIRKKKRQNIRPLPGSLYLKKTSGVPRIPLKAAVNGKIPGRYTPKKLYGYGVQKYVSNITSENAESFHFSLLQFIKLEAFTDEGGVQLADGGWLVPSNDGTAGKEEFYRLTEAFSKTYSVYVRYDVEVDHSRRPALRKIMEKDDTAAKTLVLCVCDIISRGHSPKTQSHNDTKTPHSADAKVETSAALIWLTDGWYAIKAQLDEPLTAMVHKGRLAVGGKLIIHGAQLVGSQDACSPLEAPESLMLKICANSCRPARWDAKLGFHKDPRPFLLPISCLYSNGGPVGSVDIVVLRSYPMQWMERKPDGSVVFRSSRAEEKEARRYNSHKQKAMEILFAKIQSEFENEEKGSIKPQRRRKTISHQEIANLQDGEELYEAVGDDPTYLEAHLSAHQLEALHTYRRSLMEKKQAELQDRYHRALEAEDNEMNCPKREVTPVWRLCIADSMEQPGRVYQLNLWRPSSDLQSLLKEGCRFKVYNLTTSDGKKRSCIEPVQLTGTKKTQFQELQASHEWLSTYFQPRVCTNFVNLQNPDFEPLCGEIDLAGYVISVVDGKGSSPAFYLADEKQNFVKVRCFSSLSQTGLEDVVKPRVILALSNLQLRGQSMHPTPVVYAGDLTSFSTNPKEVHLQESFSQLKTLVQCQENFFVTAEEKLSELVRSNGLSSSSSPALQRQTPASLTDRRQDIKSSVISQKPGRNLGSFTPVGRKSPTPTSSAEKDPKSLKRRRALDYLSHIPSPPPLSHLGSCQENFFVTAEEKLSELVRSNGLSSSSSPALQRQTPASLTDRRQDIKSSVISQKPGRNLGSFTPVGRKSPTPTSSAEKDPKSLKRRRALDYLSHIPSPPPLSHLGSVASPCVNKTFNPPRRSVTPSTLKTVQTPSHKPADSLGEDEWVNDEELAMIDTQALRVNLI